MITYSSSSRARQSVATFDTEVETHIMVAAEAARSATWWWQWWNWTDCYPRIWVSSHLTLLTTLVSLPSRVMRGNVMRGDIYNYWASQSHNNISACLENQFLAKVTVLGLWRTAILVTLYFSFNNNFPLRLAWSDLQLEISGTKNWDNNYWMLPETECGLSCLSPLFYDNKILCTCCCST